MGEAMFVMHFTYLLQYRDSSNGSRIRTSILANPSALSISSPSPRVQPVTTAIAVTLIVIMKRGFHYSVLKGHYYLSFLQTSKPRDSKWLAWNASASRNPGLQSLSPPPATRVFYK